MMRREIDGGPVVVEKRQEGLTVDEALKKRHPDLFRPFGHLWWKKRESSFSTPPLRFESIGTLRISVDKKHILAVAKDEDRLFLVRDERILLAGNFSSFSIEAATPDLSHLVVISRDHQGKKALLLGDWAGEVLLPFGEKAEITLLKQTEDLQHFLVETVDEQGKKSLDSFDTITHLDFHQTSLIKEADDLALADDLSADDTWLSKLPIASTIDETTSLSIWDEKRNLLGDFTVPLVLNPDSVELVAHKDDCSVVIWKGNLDGRECVFKNEELLAGKASYYNAYCNADLSRVLLTSGDEDEAEIILNGQGLLQSQARIKYCAADMETGYAVASLIDGEKWRLFYLTPQTHGILDDHFNDIPEIRVYENHIKAIVVRNGVRREITIRDRQ